jgi:hypothetical protein
MKVHAERKVGRVMIPLMVVARLAFEGYLRLDPGVWQARVHADQHEAKVEADPRKLGVSAVFSEAKESSPSWTPGGMRVMV